MEALFESKNLIGDALYVSPALNAWWELHQDARIDILTHYNHIADIYWRMGVPVSQMFFDNPISEYQHRFRHTFDVTAAFKYCDVNKCHIAEAYAALLGVQLKIQPRFGHLKPVFIPTPETLRPEEKGCILVSMFSASCASRQGKPPNKMLPWPTWRVILRYLRSWGLPIRFIGGPNDRTEQLDISEEEYMLGVPLNRTALIMRESAFVVTLDNGMSHLAASQEVPTFLFYPACLGTHYILPKGNPYLGYVHMDPVTLHPVTAVTVMKQLLPNLLLKRSKECEQHQTLKQRQNAAGGA